MLLTKAECLIILENYAKEKNLMQLQLIDAKVQTATQAIGYLGDYYELTLNYVQANAADQEISTQKFFIKTVPAKSDEPAKESIFQKEAMLYETLIKKLQKYSHIKWSPTCYFTRASELIVLEHLRCTAERYTSEPQPLGSLEHARMRQLLHSLAALHAASFIYECKEQTQIAQLQEVTVAPHIAWYTTGIACIRALIEAQPKYQTEYYRDFLREHFGNALGTIYDITSASEKYRNVLCHRDPWACNIFFALDNELSNDSAAILVDYQTCRYCPPSIDVVFAIYMNLTTADKCAMESDYLDWYYACFSRDMQNHDLLPTDFLSEIELRKSYEEFRLFGAVYRALAATIIRVPPALVTNEYKYIDRSVVVLERMRVDTDFDLYMQESIDEIMELAIKKLEQ